MRYIFSLIFICLFSFAIHAAHEKCDSIYTVGKAAFDKGDYKKAAAVFRQLLDYEKGEEDMDLERIYLDRSWLGHTLYKSGEKAAAQNYEYNFYEVQPIDRLDYREAFECSRMASTASTPTMLIYWLERCLEEELRLVGENHPNIYGTYSNLSSAYFLNGQIEKSYETIDKMFAMADHIPVTTTAWKAFPYIGYGMLKMNEGDLESSKEYVDIGWTMIKNDMASNPRIYADALNGFLNYNFTLLGSDTLIQEITEVTERLKDIPAEDAEEYVNIVRVVNNFAISILNPTKGLEATSRMLELIEKDSELYSLLLFDMARLYNCFALPREALQYIDRSLQLRKALYPNEPRQWIDALYCMGESHLLTRDYQSALECFKEAYKVYSKYPYDFPNQNYYTLVKLAEASAGLKDTKQAVKYYEECLKLMKKRNEGDQTDVAMIYAAIAKCYGENDREKAMEYYRMAYDIYRETNQLENDAYVNCALALYDLESENNDQLRKRLEELKAETAGNTDLIGATKREILIDSYLLSKLSSSSDNSAALLLVDEILEKNSSLPEMDNTTFILSKASLLTMLGRFDEAWELIDEAYDYTARKYGKMSPVHMDVVYVYQKMIDAGLSYDKMELLESLGDEMEEYTATLDRNDPLRLIYSLQTCSVLVFINPEKARMKLETLLKEFGPSVKQTDSSLMMALYSSLSTLERMQGNYGKALEYGLEMEKILPNITELILRMQACSDIGTAYLLNNRLRDAEKIFLTAIEETKDLAEPPMILQVIYSSLVQVYNNMGQYSLAADYNIRRSELASRFTSQEGHDITDKINYIGSKLNLMNQSEHIKKQCFEDILAIEKYFDKTASASQYLINYDLSLPHRFKAIYYANDGNLDRAIECIERAIDKNKSIDNLSTACDIYLGASNLDMAQLNALEMKELVKDLYGESSRENIAPHKYLGDIYALKGLYNESVDNYYICFHAAQNYVNSNLLTLTAHQRTNFWNSHSSFYSIFLPVMAVSNPYPPRMNELLYDATLFSTGMLLSADQSIATIVQGGTQTMKNLYGQYVAKKENLRKMTERNALYSSGLASDDISNEVFDQLIANDEELKALFMDCENTERQLMDIINRDYADRLDNKSYSWKDVRKNIPAKAAAIEYLDFPYDSVHNCIMALVLKKNMESPAMKTVYHYRRDEMNTDSRIYKSTELADSLINSLEEFLSDCTEVYFAPHGLLCSVGLESMPRTPSSIPEGMKMYRVSSTRQLAEKRPKRKNFNATLFGGLSYDTSIEELVADAEAYPELRERGFVADNLFRANREGDIEIPDLPGTLREVNTISEIFTTSKKPSPTVKTGQGGTETALKALSGKYGSILHISTHGFYIPGATEYINTEIQTQEDVAMENSGLLMAGAAHRFIDGTSLPDNLDDGILKSSEIAKLNLNDVDLAVLSACETGLGDVTGDGVFGLQRGFKKAGVNSILMSLWKVEDEATSTLMIEFYSNWLAGKSKYESLELAKEKVRSVEKWSDPHYWAAFILLDAVN